MENANNVILLIVVAVLVVGWFYWRFWQSNHRIRMDIGYVSRNIEHGEEGKDPLYLQLSIANTGSQPVEIQSLSVVADGQTINLAFTPALVMWVQDSITNPGSLKLPPWQYTGDQVLAKLEGRQRYIAQIRASLLTRGISSIFITNSEGRKWMLPAGKLSGIGKAGA